MQKAANRPGARPYAGLPAGGEQVVTTQTVEVWRNKVKSEERSKNEWYERWGPSFGLTAPPEPAPSEKRPIRAKAYPPPHAAPASERIDAGNKYDPATAPTGVGAFQAPERTPSVRSAGSRHLGIVGAANHGKFGSTIWAQAHANVGGAASTAGTSKRSARTAASHASTVKPPASVASSKGISPSARERSELLLGRREQLQKQLAAVELALKGTAPSTSMTINSADWRDAPPPPEEAPVPVVPPEATPPATAAVLAARPHVAPSPPPLGLTRPVSKDGDALAVPLCEDPSKLHSVAGASLALPGHTLSGAMGW